VAAAENPVNKMQRLFRASNLRKFAEQQGDVIRWHESNRAYILTHGVRGIEWSNYRHLLLEYVYDVYMQYWEDVLLMWYNGKHF